MFPYTEKYTESESDIQNKDSLYKTDQTCQNTFENLETFEKSPKTLFNFINYINCIIHIL